MDELLDQSYETCRRMHRRHDPTYYWATRRLPRDIRPATHALYGYVRTADEIVDGPGRPASAEARRAALDAWERELARRPGAGALTASGRGRARRRRPPPPAAARRAAHLHALDADRLRAGADHDLGGARGLHGRVGGLRRADHGAAARRPGAPPRRLRPARAGLPARELHPRRARGQTLDRIYLPAQDRDRLRRRRAGPGPPDRDAGAARAAGHGDAPGPRALRRGRAGDRRGAGLRAHRACASRSRSTCACSTAWSGSSSTSWAAGRACARGSCPAPRWGRCADDPPGDLARRRAHRARRARRRADLRRELRGAGGGPRARRLRRRRARRRPLRDRRAPDLGVRRADALAAGHGRRGAIRQELPCMAFHTPHGSARFRLPWSWSSFDYRTLCAELWAQCGDARFEVAKVERERGGRDRRDRPRADHARRWSSTRSAGGGCSGPARTSSRPTR